MREIRNHATIDFLTVCTDGRRPILASFEAHECIFRAWRAAGHWSVGRYVVLPDHIHLFCSPARWDALVLSRWVAFWKSHFSRHW